MELTDLMDFLVAIAIGGLVGLEREIYQKKTERGFAGIRTYFVVALLGAVSSFIVQKGSLPVIGYVVLSGIILLLVTSYYVSALKGYFGLTTELSVILVFVLSSVAMIKDYQNMAVIFGVLLAIVLSMKKLLHGFARRTKEVEWHDTLKFVFMVFVILPLLPDRDISLFGVQNAFNPYNTWLMVIFVSGISFVGYVLAKTFGGTYGVGLTGILGGLVSSTAVTQSTAQDSKKNASLVKAYSFAAVAASVMKMLRVIFESWVVDSSLIDLSALPLVVMAVGGILAIARWAEKAEKPTKDAQVRLGSPLAIKPALFFGFIYTFAVFMIRALVSLDLGEVSYILMGLISGVVDVDAVTLSMANLYKQDVVDSTMVWRVVVTAVLSNLVFKAVIAKASGSKEFFKRVGSVLIFMIVIGIISILVTVL